MPLSVPSHNWEQLAALGRFADHAVQRFNGIGGVDH